MCGARSPRPMRTWPRRARRGRPGARSWAVGQLRREHATVLGLARQLGLGWDTVWSGIEPILAAAAADESRFAGVTSLGVDEHIWHHVSTKEPQDGGRGPRELTGMVDLTTDENGQVRARLLDLCRAARRRRMPTGSPSAVGSSGPGAGRDPRPVSRV